MKKKKIIVSTIIFPDLEKQLQELATLDFQKFLQLAKVDTLQIYVCMEKQKGKTLQQIVNAAKHKGLEISKTTVHDRCKKCSDNPNGIDLV